MSYLILKDSAPTNIKEGNYWMVFLWCIILISLIYFICFGIQTESTPVGEVTWMKIYGDVQWIEVTTDSGVIPLEASPEVWETVEVGDHCSFKVITNGLAPKEPSYAIEANCGEGTND